jgi:hypothetical protein
VDAPRRLVGGAVVLIVDGPLGRDRLRSPARGRVGVDDVVVAIRLDRRGSRKPQRFGPRKAVPDARREDQRTHDGDHDEERRGQEVTANELDVRDERAARGRRRRLRLVLAGSGHGA